MSWAALVQRRRNASGSTACRIRRCAVWSRAWTPASVRPEPASSIGRRRPRRRLGAARPPPTRILLLLPPVVARALVLDVESVGRHGVGSNLRDRPPPRAGLRTRRAPRRLCRSVRDRRWRHAPRSRTPALAAEIGVDRARVRSVGVAQARYAGHEVQRVWRTDGLVRHGGSAGAPRAAPSPAPPTPPRPCPAASRRSRRVAPKRSRPRRRNRTPGSRRRRRRARAGRLRAQSISAQSARPSQSSSSASLQENSSSGGSAAVAQARARVSPRSQTASPQQPLPRPGRRSRRAVRQALARIAHRIAESHRVGRAYDGQRARRSGLGTGRASPCRAPAPRRRRSGSCRACPSAARWRSGSSRRSGVAQVIAVRHRRWPSSPCRRTARRCGSRRRGSRCS